MRKRWLLAAFLIPRLAWAYEVNTHRWIMQQAGGVLMTRGTRGEYDEALTHLDDLKYGVEHEDDLADGDANPVTIRVMHHFYRPIDDHGLRFPGFSDFPSSYHWAAEANAQNECDWTDAVAAYRSGAPGSLQVAYRCLGQVIHLVQDATVPAHTHLDIHGPQEPEDYENYCRDRTRSDTDADLPRPPTGAAIPSYPTLRDYWNGAARQAYFRNRFPADLRNTAAPTGRLKEMYPDLHWNATDGQWDITVPDLGNYDGDPTADDEWWEEIANVDNVLEQPGWYYLEETKYTPVLDKIFVDPLNPQRDRYVANSTPMTQNFARDLVPVAILHSAGLVKKWMDDVVPDVRLSRLAGNGAEGSVMVLKGSTVTFEVVVDNRGKTAATVRLDTPWVEPTSGLTGALAPQERVAIADGAMLVKTYALATSALPLGTYTVRAELTAALPGDRTARDDARELTVQVVDMLPADAGTSAGDGGGAGGDAGSGDGGTAGSDDDGGCGCRTGARGRPGAGPLAAVVMLALAGFWLVRRRRDG